MQKTLPIGRGDDAAVVAGGREQLNYLIHDIQSAVTSVSLMVELLELDARAGGDSKQWARAVSAQNSCRQMVSLCTEVARLLDGTADENPATQEFDLLELLVEAMTVYSPLYDLAGKTLKLVTKRRPPSFLASGPSCSGPCRTFLTMD